MITISMETDSSEKSLKALATAAGLSMQELHWDTFRLWLNLIEKFTPPFPQDGPKAGNKPAAKKAGEIAIERDFKKIFSAVDNPGALESWNDRLVTNAGDSIIVLTKRGKARIDKTALKKFSVGEIISRQRKARDPRGRVRPERLDPTEFNAGRVLVPRKDLNKAMKIVKGNVGKLKAGWLPALNHFAALSKGAALAPAWAKRHSTAGSFVDRVRKDGIGQLVAENKAPFARQNKSMDSSIDFSLGIVQKGLTRSAKNTVSRLVKQFNGGKT